MIVAEPAFFGIGRYIVCKIEGLEVEHCVQYHACDTGGRVVTYFLLQTVYAASPVQRVL